MRRRGRGRDEGRRPGHSHNRPATRRPAEAAEVGVPPAGSGEGGQAGHQGRADDAANGDRAGRALGSGDYASLPRSDPVGSGPSGFFAAGLRCSKGSADSDDQLDGRRRHGLEMLPNGRGFWCAPGSNPTHPRSSRSASFREIAEDGAALRFSAMSLVGEHISCDRLAEQYRRGRYASWRRAKARWGVETPREELAPAASAAVRFRSAWGYNAQPALRGDVARPVRRTGPLS